MTGDGARSTVRGLALARSLLALVAVSGCGRLGFSAHEGQGDAAGSDASESRANLAFVTANQYDGDLGGPAGADLLCTSEAANAGLTGDFVALLWAADRPDPTALLAGSRGWQLPSGEWIADLPGEIATGAFLHPLNAMPSGVRVGEPNEGFRFWTGQLAGSCDDWRSTTTAGDQAYVPQYARLSDGALACSDRYRIACFERGFSVAPVLPPITHKRLFVTASTWSPGGGVASADAVCEAEASANGIGASRALLPTDVPAVARIPGASTTVYQQPDGIEVGLLSNPDSYFLLGADRLPHEGSLWTGGNPLELPVETCENWTMSAARRAIMGVTAWGGYGDINDLTPCDRAGQLLCAEL